MMKKKTPTGKKPFLNPSTRTNLLALIEEISKWLRGSYGTLPSEITLQINPTVLVATAARLADKQLVAHAKTLRGEACRVERELSNLTADDRVTRIVNNLKSLLHGLDDLLRRLQQV
jgi:hypothetical protein